MARVAMETNSLRASLRRAAWVHTGLKTCNVNTNVNKFFVLTMSNTLQNPLQPPQDAAARHLLKPVSWLYRKRYLQQANQFQTEWNTSWFRQPSTDPHGKVLQRLRLDQRKDPCQLATEACLSVAQLQELEYGDNTLFYCPSLRTTAARRVARILGVDWDDIVSGKVQPPPVRESVQTLPSRERTAEVIALKPGFLFLPRTATMPASTSSTQEQVAFSSNTLLARPADMDDAQAQAQTQAPASSDTTSPAPAVQAPRHKLWLVLGLLAMAAGASAAWADLNGVDIHQVLHWFQNLGQTLRAWRPGSQELL